MKYRTAVIIRWRAVVALRSLPVSHEDPNQTVLFRVHRILAQRFAASCMVDYPPGAVRRSILGCGEVLFADSSCELGTPCAV